MGSEYNKDDQNNKGKTENETPNIINQDKSEIINQKLITIIIPLISGDSWKKTYNIETSLSQIASDFQLDNNMKEIQKNYFIEYSYKNNIINMDSSPLKSLIDEETTSIHINQIIKPIPGDGNLSDNIDIIGKPILDPFQIYCFEIKSKIFKKILYNEEKIKEKGLDKIGVKSSYCNGNNHLFISGGEDQASNENIGLFWDIDLKEDNDFSPIKMFPKNNHSMIYIEKKVYIIGGDDVNTLIYDMEDKEIIHWENLNYKRFEPSLIKHGNYLFCFDMSKKYINNFDNIINFEKIDLYKPSAEWEIIVPEISPNVLNSLFSQKFFGVIEDCKENIIFVGGIHDKDKVTDNNNNNSIENTIYEEIMNLQYNTNKNMIEKSDIQYTEVSFSEKCFLSIDENTYVNLPNFNKRLPKIAYFFKDKNVIDISSYHTKYHSRKRLNKIQTTQLKPSFDGLNFDMPSLNSDEISKINKNYLTNIDINSINKKTLDINQNISEKYLESENSIKSEIVYIEKINISLNELLNEENNNNTSNKKELKNTLNELKENNSSIKDSKNIKQTNNSINKITEKEKENNHGDENEKDNKDSFKKSEIIKNDNQVNNENILDNIKDVINPPNYLIKSRNNMNMRILYIKEPKILERYHSSSDCHFSSSTDIISSNRLKKKIKEGYIIPPKKVNLKHVKGQVKKINKI